MESGFDINNLFRQAQFRWLKSTEVLSILQNYENFQITQKPLVKPPSGSFFLFNKRVLRFFRNDGHLWQKKNNGKAVNEAHERLKIRNVETLNVYYARGECNPRFQRRCYWMLDPARNHIVLVHYLEIEGRQNSESNMSTDTSSFFNPTSNNIMNQVSSPGCGVVMQDSSSVGEVNSEYFMGNNENSTGSEEGLENPIKFSNSEVDKALRKLTAQLSLGDDEGSHDNPIYIDDQLQYSNESNELELSDNGVNFPQDRLESLMNELSYSGQRDEVDAHNMNAENMDLLGNNGMHDPSHSHYSKDNLQLQLSETMKFLLGSDESIESPSAIELQTSKELMHSKPVVEKQLFKFQEVTPEWAFSSQSSKVIIMGEFLCDPSEYSWAAMFDDTEAPLETIQEGVLCCRTPQHVPGRVKLCITSGNRKSCSEIREFEYFIKPNTSYPRNNLPEEVSTKNTELLFLVRFVQTLLEKEDEVIQTESGTKGNNRNFDDWQEITDSLLLGNANKSDISNWILLKLLKSKLQCWISTKCHNNQMTDCSLSKQDQGIIHLISALGYEWALNPILNLGVGINFRDLKGWTALHWAAHFGREKMVAALLAAGASVGAVTDPSNEDPIGKPPASIAAISGHQGLAGYLSEVALNTHLSFLTAGESNVSKMSTTVKADRGIEKGNDLTLKHSLDAVRDATLAAALIQSAFRAHSFRKRQQKVTPSMRFDEYDLFTPEEILSLSDASRHQRSPHGERLQAALCIQKKFRGWKGRKKFLNFRRRVVKIQAHVRGHQMRKKYKFLWTVGIVEKVILRWRRRGVGLRGFRSECENNNGMEEHDILKMFRKQKVDLALDEAVSSVVSMSKSAEARQQYHRMLQCYHKAKVELENMGRPDSTTGDDLLVVGDVEDVEDEEMNQLIPNENFTWESLLLKNFGNGVNSNG